MIQEPITSLYNLISQISWIRYFLLSTIILLVYNFFWKSVNRSKVILNPNIRNVPKVSGSFPLIGHFPYLLWNPKKFLVSTAKKYGGIFQVQIFKTRFTFVVDRVLVRKFFESKDMSLSEFTKESYTSGAISDTIVNPLDLGARIIRKYIRNQCTGSKFIVRYEDRMDELIKEFDLLTEKSTPVSLTDHLRKYTVQGITQSLFGIRLDTQESLDHIFAYGNLTERLTGLTLIFSFTLIKTLLQRYVRRVRKRFLKHIIPELHKYTEDPSLILFTAEKEKDRKLTEDEMGEVVLGVTNNTSSNIFNSIAHTILQVAQNPKKLIDLRTELDPLMSSKDILESDWDRVLLSPELEAVTMEAIRRSVGIGVTGRIPKQHCVIGDYWVGDTDRIVIPGSILTQEFAEPVYKDPLVYDPDRFLGEKKESTSPLNILAWGAGRHHCPGQRFSIWFVKSTVAKLITEYDFQVLKYEPSFGFNLTPIMSINSKVIIKKRTRVPAA